MESIQSNFLYSCVFQSNIKELLGEPQKAKEKLGWIPEITVQEMCKEMVQEDLKLAQRNALLKQSGHEVFLPWEADR